jgi:hypothetical protein
VSDTGNPALDKVVHDTRAKITAVFAGQPKVKAKLKGQPDGK